jgi:hypothetical protein
MLAIRAPFYVLALKRVSAGDVRVFRVSCVFPSLERIQTDGLEVSGALSAKPGHRV